MSIMTCRGYEAVVEFDVDAGLFHGEVLALKDVITFQARSSGELDQALAESLEDYFEFCRARGGEPEIPPSPRAVSQRR